MGPVELAALVIETVAEFVAYDGTDGSIICSVVGEWIEERRFFGLRADILTNYINASELIFSD